MSWTRRLLVACAFALMLAGVALMVIEEDELFLALSLGGFVLVLVAVPSLPHDEETEEPGARAAESGPAELMPAPQEAEPPERAAPAPAAVTAAPDPTASGPAVPEPDAPDPAPPEPIAPEPAAPEPIAPEPAAPEPIAPGRAAPEFPPGGEPGGRLRDLSPRGIALAGAAAGAALWLWRRATRR